MIPEVVQRTWAVLCLFNLIVWYVLYLRSVTLVRGVAIMVPLFALCFVNYLVEKKLKHRGGLTMLVIGAELVAAVLIALQM